MKKILFATNNPSKIKRFSEKLLEKDIELLSLKDLDIEFNVNEDGTSAIENAIKKVKSCYELVKMPIIGMDDALYMEGLPDDIQPGLFVRRIDGKNLTDEEMLKYYSGLVKKYGKDGKIDCKWVYGLALINEKGECSTYTWEKANFYMVEEISDKVKPGYPLNSISKYKKIDKYFNDVTESEKELIKINEDHVIDFIIKSIQK